VDDPQPLDGRPDWLAASFKDASAIPEMVAEAVRALARSGIPLLAFELEGARLSDAFLSMTGDDSE
jgi:hypothetical protein